jgi:hypothetical protein
MLNRFPVSLDTAQTPLSLRSTTDWMLSCYARSHTWTCILYSFSCDAWSSLGNTTSNQNKGLEAAEAGVLTSRYTVVWDVSALTTLVQCSVVTFYRSAKENELFENRCKANSATHVKYSALYHVTRLVPRSRRKQPTQPTLSTFFHSVRVIGYYPSFTREETEYSKQKPKRTV